MRYLCILGALLALPSLMVAQPAPEPGAPAKQAAEQPLEPKANAIETALIAAVVLLVTAAVTATVTLFAQERKLRAEMRTQFMTEEAVRRLLNHPDY